MIRRRRIGSVRMPNAEIRTGAEGQIAISVEHHDLQRKMDLERA